MSGKTSTAKMIAGAGGVLLIVSLFLKWTGIDVGASGVDTSQLPSAAQDTVSNIQDAASANAFDLFGWIPLLYIVLGVLAALPLVLDLSNLEIELPFEPSFVGLTAGLLALGGMLVVVDSPGSMKIGAWIALLSALAMAIGGYMQWSEYEEEDLAPVSYAQPPSPPAAPQPPPQGPPTPQPPPPPPQQG